MNFCSGRLYSCQFSVGGLLSGTHGDCKETERCASVLCRLYIFRSRKPSRMMGHDNKVWNDVTMGGSRGRGDEQGKEERIRKTHDIILLLHLLPVDICKPGVLHYFDRPIEPNPLSRRFVE